MSASVAVTDFLTSLRASRILSEEALNQFLDSSTGQSILNSGSDPQAFARHLIRAGLVTPFQARHLLKGRTTLTLGKYILLDQIGTGGMSRVFLARHLEMQHRVAIKLLPSELAREPDSLQRFYREARAIAALNHPNIVRAIDIDHIGDSHYLIMEYVEGDDLLVLVKKQGQIAAEVALNWIRQAALGLEHIHAARLVHRDIKPSNLLLDQSGTIRILDLGLARFMDHRRDGLTQKLQPDTILGTADYMSPEQAINTHDVDIRSDIYSLGATLYFLVSGKAPFEGMAVTQKLLATQIKEPPALEESCPDLPAAIIELIARMMRKEPRKRFANPTELIAAIDLIQQQSQLNTLNSITDATTKPMSRPRRALEVPATTPTPSRRNPLIYVGFGLLVVVCIVLGIVAFGSSEKSSVEVVRNNPATPVSKPPITEQEVEKKSTPEKEPAKIIPAVIPQERPETARVLRRFDMGDQTPFRKRIQGTTDLEVEGIPRLPQNWAFNGWDGGATVELVREVISGSSAFGIKNVQGQKCAQIFNPGPMVTLNAGVQYVLRMEYLTTGTGHGGVRMCGEGLVQREFPLKNTNGSWQRIDFPFQEEQSESRLLLFIQNWQAGAENGLYFRSLELLDAGKAQPASQRTVWSLDLSGARPFRQRVRGSEVLERDGSGDLPEGWKGQTWDPASIGDIAIEFTGPKPALVSRGVTGKPTNQMLNTRPVARLEAGKKYRFFIEYLTEMGGQGVVDLWMDKNKQYLSTAINHISGKWVMAEYLIDLQSETPLRVNLNLDSSGAVESVFKVRRMEVREIGFDGSTGK